MLSIFSEVFEKLIFEQINDHMQNKFSKYLTGFRKNHSTQNVLVVMNEKWKAILNKSMDLSKAFDTLDHSLLLAKLSVYGFGNFYSKLFNKQISGNNNFAGNNNWCHSRLYSQTSSL